MISLVFNKIPSFLKNKEKKILIKYNNIWQSKNDNIYADILYWTILI